jgi:hypothetical protein
MGRLDANEIRAAAVRIVEESCAEQGIEVKVVDPVALVKVLNLLVSGRELDVHHIRQTG